MPISIPQLGRRDGCGVGGVDSFVGTGFVIKNFQGIVCGSAEKNANLTQAL